MRLPYQRVMIMQIALLLGAILVSRFNEPLLASVALIMVKTAFDWRAYQHEQAATERTAASEPPASL